MNLSKGKVYLIGAGPGDPGLITLRGAEILRHVDVVLFDGLSNDELLAHSRQDAIVLCVGKNGHGGVWTQSQINTSMIEHALAGRSVARLKGGDTAIFARTAEEVDALIASDVEYEIVPGITAALALAAYTGIPLTHRDWSSAVALVTAQLQPADGDNEAEDPIDWRALAAFPGTLVLYMGVSSATFWSHRLISNGKAPTTPVALIRRISWPDQKIIRCTLGDLASTIQNLQGLQPPVLSVVGEVVNLAPSSHWFSERPLHGKHLVVASPPASATKLAAMLRQRGAMVTLQPAMEIQPVSDWTTADTAIHSLREFDWVIFSSIHGVDYFVNRILELGLDMRVFGDSRVAAVGESTRQALGKYHLKSDMTPETGGVEDLIRLLRDQCNSKRFLFVKTAAGKRTGIDAVRAGGGFVTEIDVYQQTPVESWPSSLIHQFRDGQVDGIVATSINVAKHSCQLLGKSSYTQNWFVLSEPIANTLRDGHCRSVVTADQPTFLSLVEAIETSFRA